MVSSLFLFLISSSSFVSKFFLAVSAVSLVADYLVRNPVEIAIQNTKEFSEHEVNTETVTSTTRGMCHSEGGWPTEINPAEKDQVSRFRKKAEKTPEFQQQVINVGTVRCG